MRWDILKKNISEFESRFPNHGLDFLHEQEWLEKAVLEPKYALLKNTFRFLDICQECHEKNGAFLNTERCPSFMMVYNKKRSKESESIYFEPVRCSYIMDRDAKNLRLSITRNSGIPGDLEERATFDTFDVSRIEPESAKKQAKEALDTCMRYVDRYEEMKAKGIGLYIWGPPLSGKTHLALAVCNAVADRYREPYRYTTSSRLVSTYRKKVKDTYSDFDSDENAFSFVLDELTDFEGLLLLDDLGSEPQSDATINLLSTIISNRCEAGRPTLFTSYFKVVSEDGGDDFVLQDRYELWGPAGAAITSKIVKTCARIPLTKVKPYVKKVSI